MLTRALSYCLAEDDPQSLENILDSLPKDDHERQWMLLQHQQRVFLSYLRNPHLSLEDHQHGIQSQNLKDILESSIIETQPFEQPSQPPEPFIFDTNEEVEHGPVLNVVSQSMLRSLQTPKTLFKPQATPPDQKLNQPKIFYTNKGQGSPYQDGWSDNILSKFYRIRVKSAGKGSSTYSIVNTQQNSSSRQYSSFHNCSRRKQYRKNSIGFQKPKEANETTNQSILNNSERYDQSHETMHQMITGQSRFPMNNYHSPIKQQRYRPKTAIHRNRMTSTELKNNTTLYPEGISLDQNIDFGEDL